MSSQPGRSTLPRYLLPILLIAGCGKVGDPLPPLVRVPEAADDFSVEQIGYELHFQWTNPRRNVDQSAATDLERAFIRAGETVIAEVVVETPGESQTAALPARGYVGSRHVFSVYFQTAAGRLSDSSNAFTLAVVEVPGSGTRPSGTVDQGRVRIEWRPPGEDAFLVDGYFVYRSGRLLSAVPVQGTTFEDTGFLDGETYSYQVVPVRRVDDRLVAGIAYPPLTVTAVDRTPPAPPEGLRVQPFGRDAAGGDAAGVGAFVRWSPGAESDIARYRVYRRSSPGERFVPVNGEGQATTVYTETNYEPGREYAASAVDRSGNESPLSDPVSAP